MLQNLINFPCSLCGADDYKLVYDSNLTEDSHSSVDLSCTNFGHNRHFQIVKCNLCDMVYSTPRLSAEMLHQLYANVEDSLYLQEERGRVLTSQNALKNIKKTSGALLDIGCGTGVFLESARKSGFLAYGVEPSMHASKIAEEKGFKICNQSVPCQLPWNIKFDVITMWDVIEHLDNPAEVLRWAVELLKPDGELHLSTMRIDTIYPKLVGEKWPWYMEMHIHYFSKKSISQMLEKSGAKMTNLQPYKHTVHQSYLRKKAAHLWPPLRIIANSASYLLSDKEGFIKVFMGDMMHVTAKKNEAPSLLQNIKA